MKYSFAPLEGIGGYVYRNAHSLMFGGCDAYYAPFITPVENERLNKKCLRDILPENNRVPRLVVQVLTNQSEPFFKFEAEAVSMGYDEININIGCPSGTVVKKNRGAGFLRDVDALDKFFETVFSKNKLPVSLKTRIGFYDASESEALVGVFNKYPFKNIIVHPRTRMDYYKGSVNMEAFSLFYDKSKNPVCYNGDLKNIGQIKSVRDEFPDICEIMIGRGAVANPAIFRELDGKNKITTPELIDFSFLLAEEYYKVLGTDVYTLHKLKEVWMYMMENYPEEKKILKEIKKSNTVKELHFAVKKLPEMAV